MLEANQRIFIYLRVTSTDGELARSKVRELAGLGTAMADLAGELLSREDVPSRDNLRFEYVEAETHQPLISMFTDVACAEQVVAGRIPPVYQQRMLEDPPRIDARRFEERAGRQLDPARRYELAESLRGPQLNVLGLIRDNIDEDGVFEIRLPIDEH